MWLLQAIRFHHEGLRDSWVPTATENGKAERCANADAGLAEGFVPATETTVF
jgi:hypothetical protein